MKLEDEIKQSKFKNEQLKAGINILYTASFLSNYQAKLFKPYGITGPQFNVLRILRGQLPNPATINLLIERMLDKSSNASRIVEKLRVKKFIERIQCPEDRRAVNVKITEKGMQLLAEIDAVEESFFGGLNNLSTEQAIKLNELLDQIRS